MHLLRAAALALIPALVLAGCGGTAPATTQVVTVTAAPAAPPDPSSAADRAGCVDLDARGGSLDNVLVVPMMTGAAGQKSVNVNAAQLARAASSVREVGQGSIQQASPAIADAAQRMVTSADALGVYSHSDSTALLTSFVTLAPVIHGAVD